MPSSPAQSPSGAAPDAGLSRRTFLQTGAAAALLGSLAANPAGAATGSRRDLIVRENAREGSRDWQLTRVRVDAQGVRAP